MANAAKGIAMATNSLTGRRVHSTPARKQASKASAEYPNATETVKQNAAPRNQRDEPSVPFRYATNPAISSASMGTSIIRVGLNTKNAGVAMNSSVTRLA